ncbi:Dehydroquinase [Bartonella apihabitans]|uniref:3-dehydroquinate dehydratase n=1 Tax=Bartonella apihabitans TaxID=2750929 RepID=A0A1U9M8Y3_9HYPH|nr:MULTISPECIES: type II 3-dehydroquinate dehydratase [Bartonella]AQT41777.1 3-dehydroquinate dehydratase [Bartonella apihabitans]AQT44005.1 3-dehydroquinate dehydratase [Bartonella apihabitans]MBH9995245.1 type II 3-dehydroquinate dehydratase [Bartonella sp. P0291]MBH9996411.1 type II 3-dehydroquinate dehydratase [Bartonella sp. M0192]MBH9998572.1 type II 3-dehydroquinate dehydratase [Bartonella sp. M0191]
MAKKITVLNGPNLNFLGRREPAIYGRETLKDIENMTRECARSHGFDVDFLQSNCEGELVGFIQAAIGESVAIIINPAAYSHTSIAILDALKMFEGVVVEVHLSNIHKRETYRHHSFVSERADAVIAGCGSDGYRFAVEYIVQHDL